MVTFILIYWIVGGYAVGGGLVTGQATFADLPACQSALQHIKDDWASRAPNGATYGIAGGECAASTTGPVPGG